jgi:hypothetical protein
MARPDRACCRGGAAPGRRQSWHAAACCLLLLFVIGGCRRSGPVVEMVEGVVALDGDPIEGVTVTFKPVSGTGLMAFGMTRADGRFTLNATRGGKAGAGTAVGDYAVTFTKTKGGYEIIEGPTAPEAPRPQRQNMRSGPASRHRKSRGRCRLWSISSPKPMAMRRLRASPQR